MYKALNSKDFLENFFLLRKYILLYVFLFFAIFTVAVYFIDNIVIILSQPLLKTLNCQSLACSNLIYTSFEEKFITFMYLAFFIALLFSLPFAIILLLFFIFPALYNREKIFYLIISCCFLFSFYLGVYLCYKFFLIKIWSFFINFASSSSFNEINFYPKLKEYFAFVKKMFLISGLVMQTPIILITLGFLRVVRVKQLKSIRKYVILILFVFSAIVTPPDPFSQIILAIFLIICYEFAIFAIIILNRVFNK